ncbi:beta-propeller fold lactonase family protein [Spirosoma sp. BT702]|uniref:Beta-propeller fold lactonase family protein n=1 Tax=Spirosoma profusum TaxID=2771354 RepID=A0A927GA43_9BACT|nr:putative Ig domain-containing protein [Spirosoma profusum]MBD2705246.1 beta-propeller fold lactonase family protein [Spirosoma profusum]
MKHLYFYELLSAGPLACSSYLFRLTPILILASWLVMVSLSASMAQTTIYVRVDGPSATTATATSWATALSGTALQGALASAPAGTRFLIGAGLYKPTSTTARTVSFSIASGVQVYGGYAGSGSTPDTRTAFPSSTTLSGNIGSESNKDDNSYHVVTFRNVSDQTRLDGIVITGGNCNVVTGDVLTYGGGILNDGSGTGNSSKPTLVNLIVVGNSGNYGGGLANYARVGGNSSSSLTNVSFLNNLAAVGGGMLNEGLVGGISSPILTNVSFTTNTATTGGGGIYNQGSDGNSSPVLTNVSFLANSALAGGGMFNDGFQNNCSPVLTNVSFLGNSASSSNLANNGGAIYNERATPTLVNGILFGNGAGSQITNAGNPPVTARYTLFEQGVTGYTTDPTNLTTTTSPFVSATDLRLRAGAEAINSGDNTAYIAAGGPLLDLAGNPRRLGTIDRGAYEYQALAANSVVYVTPSGGGQFNGSSWANALPGIGLQAVLANATSSTFLVGAGLYNPTTGTDQAVSFVIPSGVQVYGGYVGSGLSPDVRTSFPSSTTFSGDIGTLNDNSDNSNNVVTFRNVSDQTRLDGMVITGGNANGLPNPRGGGIYNNGQDSPSNPTLVNLSFVSNTAINQGGALFNASSYGEASPRLINCAFTNNSAPNGGAIFNDGINGNSSPVLINVSFTGNSASKGGAMDNYAGAQGTSNPVLVNVSFRNNYASNTYGGSALHNYFANVKVTNGIFFDNGGDNTFDNVLGSLTIQSSLLEPSETDYTTDPSNLTTTTSPFVSETGLQLNPCSPAINTGDNTAYTSANGPATDLMGNSRFYAGGQIDRGAYEFQGAPSQPLVITQQPLSSTAVCDGATVTATVSVTGSSPSYQWYKDGTSLGAAQQSSTLSLTNVTAAQGGSYSVVITNACNSVTSTTFSLTVNALPTPALVSSGTLNCAQTSVTLTANGGTSYTFAGSGIVSQNATSGTAVVNAPGTYSVTVTTSSGCKSSTTVTVQRDISPASVAITPTSATLNCATSAVSLSAVGTAGSYRWSTGATTASISVTVAGPYSVTLTGTNGCTAVATRQLGQEPGPTVNPVSSKTVCVGTVVAPIVFSGNADRYQWINSNTSIGLPASGTGSLNSFTALNNGSTAQTAVITVIPQSAPKDLLYISTTGTGINPVNGQRIFLDFVRVYDPISGNIITSVPVGRVPFGVSVSPDGSRVYVTNTLSNNVSVINTATNTVIATIPVGNNPKGVSVSLNGSRVYVANTDSDNVSVINTATNSVTATIPVGNTPVGVSVSPDGNRVYVANTNTVSVINTATNSVTATITVGGILEGISVSPDGSRVYVTNQTSNVLSVINTATNSVAGIIGVGNEPSGISVSPDGRRVYVANYSTNNMGVINTATNSVTAIIDLGDSPVGVSVSLDGSRVYVVNEVAENVSVIDAASNTVVTTSPTFSGTMVANLGNFVRSVRCQGIPISFTITVPPTPIATLSASTSVLTCTTPTATLTATVGTGAPGSTYRFSGPGIVTSSQTSGTALVNVAGVYSVTVTSASNCTSITSLTIGQDKTPPSLTISPSSATLTCATPIISLSAVGVGTYRWNTGATTSSISVSVATTYSVTTTGTNGCTATANASVSQDQSLPSLTISPSSTTLTCATPIASLSAVGSGTYRWSTGATTPSISVSVATTYSVTSTGANGCSATASIGLSLDQTPPSLTISPPSATLSCTTSLVSLSAIGNGTYQWNTGATTSSISVSVADTYSVTLTGANGCSSTASASVTYQNCAPTLANDIPPQSATLADAFSYTIPATTFTDPETPNSLTLMVAGLPAGLSFVSPNTISGTPSTTLGTPFTVTVVATDPGGLSASTSFVLTVQPRSFAITGVTMLDCNHLSYYERRINFMVSFEATNGQPISLSVVNELRATTVNGPYQLNVFTDNPVIVLRARQQGTPGEVSFAYNWLANCANGNPKVENSIPPQSATVGQAFSYTIPANTFTDAETPNNLTLSVVGLPAGLSFVSPNLITGVASATASSFSSVTVTATDPVGGSISTLLPLSVMGAGGCVSMYSVQAGSWNDASTWSCGRVPLITDVVTLNHAVSLPASYQGQALRVIYSASGRLLFGPGSRLRVGGN